MPEGWNIVDLPSTQNKCNLKLQSDSSKDEIHVSLAYNEYLVVANELGFDYFNGAWLTMGRQGSRSKADEIETDIWEGLGGTMEAGCHSTAGYVGTCVHSSIVLREKEIADGRVLTIQSNVQNPLVIEKIYKTLQPVF